eukprot:TRINITY_DN3873_c0_g1_i1.p1 TRINITY_DN3873_c0_g1~~TRINITY_DN3873_c0_g1_i1.p1  ORF type:complete len:440 (+),score=49.64 TRINITY_DN3873_c0_g1_i1:267-1586(+)
MRVIVVPLLVLGLLLLSLTVSEARWVSFGNGASHHGRVRRDSGAGQPVSWSTTLHRSITECPRSLSVSHRQVFIPANGSVVALSAVTGSFLWSQTLVSPQDIISAPSVSEREGGMLFVGARNCLFALSLPGEGRILWYQCIEVREDENVLVMESVMHFQPAIDDELGIVATVAFGGDLHNVLAFDMVTGEQIWNAQVGASWKWSDVHAPSLVIHSISERVFSSWIRGDKEKGYSSIVACHDLKTGKTIYEYDTEAISISSVSVDIQGFAFVGTSEGLFSLNGQGKLRWETKFKEITNIPPHCPVLNEQDQVVYLMTATGVHCYNMRDGLLLSSVFLPSSDILGSETQMLSYNPTLRKLFVGSESIHTYQVHYDGSLNLEKKIMFMSSLHDDVPPSRAPISSDEFNLYYISSSKQYWRNGQRRKVRSRLFIAVCLIQHVS